MSWERHQIKFHRSGERETDVIFHLVQNLVSSVTRTVVSFMKFINYHLLIVLRTENFYLTTSIFFKDGLVDEVERKDELRISFDQPSSIYRTPDFCWSDVHLRLLDDLLVSIENTVEEWKKFEFSFILFFLFLRIQCL